MKDDLKLFLFLAVLCDKVISEDVVLDPSCNYHEYEECGYMCMSDSEPQVPIPTVKCEKGGIWNGSISCGGKYLNPYLTNGFSHHYH